jgi:ribosomal protein L7/L12
MNFKDLLDNQIEIKIKELLKNGKKVEAVAAVQNQLKIGLKNSKDLVDQLELSTRSQISNEDSLS